MKISYRPELDGLRAISILLVIFNHLDMEIFVGGFIGVDVFFVISGYLITGILAGDVRNDRMSVAAFYKRRIIRLAPAYFFVLAVTTIAGIIFLLPADLLNYFKSVIYSTFFLANFYMWDAVGGYFGAQAHSIPLLHLWSLAVEEQFYIFWPLVVWLVCRACKAVYIPWVFLAATLVAIAISQWGAEKYPDGAYYLLPGRIFELAIGALIVFLPTGLRDKYPSRFLSILGLVFIAYPAFTYTEKIAFPGIKALVPCIGAAMIIIFSDHKSDWLGRILAFRPLNFIGRLSYPAYLWHWPAIVFLNVCAIKINFPMGVLLVVSIFYVSWLTYRYLELPAQQGNRFSFIQVFCVGFALPAALLIVVSLYGNFAKGWPQRFSDDLNTKAEAINSHAEKIRSQCIDQPPAKPGSQDNCILGINKPEVDFILVGDSHANHFTAMIDVMAKSANLRGYDITQSNGIYLPDTRHDYIQRNKKFDDWAFWVRNDVVQSLIEEKKYRAVILAGAYATHIKTSLWKLDHHPELTSEEVFKKQFDAAILQIISSGAVPIVIKGSPLIKNDQVYCGIKNARFHTHENCNNPRSNYLKYFSDWSDYLDVLSKKYPQLVVIDPALVMCDAATCYSELNGVPLYKDGGHLNYRGSELLGKLYLDRFANPLQKITKNETK